MNTEDLSSIIEFSCHHKHDPSVNITAPESKISYKIDGDCDINQLCDAFENFLLACGYRLNSGETIGIINV
jgi:hypothetical protein